MKPIIKGLRLPGLRNGEYLQYFKHVLAVIEEENFNPPEIIAAAQLLQAVVDELEDLFRLPKANPITSDMQQFDAERDNALKGMRLIAKAYTYSNNNTLKTHAQHLLQHINRYGKYIFRDNYHSETATVDALVQNWGEQPDLAAAIAALHLGDWKTALQTANQNFNDSSIKRIKSRVAAPEVAFKQKRPQANVAYYTLRNLINAYAIIHKEDGPHTTTIATINVFIQDCEETIRRRKGKE